MNVFEYFKRKEIDTINSSFYARVVTWGGWYKGNVRKFHQYRVYGGQGTYTRCNRHSLGMAKKVCEDMANLLLNERVKITLSDVTTDTFVKKILTDCNFSVLGNEYQERKAATGTVAYIPYLKDAEVNQDGEVQNGSIGINFVEAENIFPVSWENGIVKECIFTFVKTYKRKKYVQFQCHKMEQGQYVIENAVVECTTGSGRDLSEVEWKDIPAFYGLSAKIVTGSSKRQFVIDKLNIVNNADEDDTNPMGVPLFANSIDTLRKLDLTYDSYTNEFDLGRKRIFVAPEMLEDKNGNPTFDTNDAIFYRLPEDYLNGSNDPIKEINMVLRIEEHSKAINDDLNYLSLKCGFGTERYKFDGGGIKTATEVISENSDMYRTIQKHEIILDAVIKELLHIIVHLGIVTNVVGLKEDAEITINFDDSIIEDKQTERSEDRKDVAMGVMDLAEYRAKWYAETKEVAASKIPEQTGVIP